MRLVSINLNKRLGRADVATRFSEWIATQSPDLIMVQEPWAGPRSKPPKIDGLTFLDGDHLLAAWAAGAQGVVAARRPSDRLQLFETAVGTVANVYLSPDNAGKRRTGLDELRETLLGRSGLTLVVGDFNLAPEPGDGLFGLEPSAFTSAQERVALRRLLADCGLTDVLAPAILKRQEFTFERVSNGKRSRFRCDLLLGPSSSLSNLRAFYDHSVRTGEACFTDHSAIVVDFAFGSRSKSRVPPLRQADAASPPPFAHASVRTEMTAIKRSTGSRIAKLLVAHNLIRGTVLDYGCGRGADVEYYRKHRIAADGWDPYVPFGFSAVPTRRYDCVTLVYVLNVLPAAGDRLNALRAAWEHVRSGGLLVISARSPSAIASEAKSAEWTPYSDGYLSSEIKRTFQRGISSQELLALLPADAEPLDLPRSPSADITLVCARRR